MVTNPGLQAEGGWYFTYFFGLQPLLLPVLIILLISKHVYKRRGVVGYPCWLLFKIQSGLKPISYLVFFPPAGRPGLFANRFFNKPHYFYIPGIFRSNCPDVKAIGVITPFSLIYVVTFSAGR